VSVIVRTVTRLLVPLVLIFGAYIIMHGHLTPGGGFQGGAVVASAVALLIVAFGAERLRRHRTSLTSLEDLGALLFVVLAFTGIGSTFFYNALAGTGTVFGGQEAGTLWAGGTVPLMNWAVGLKVMAGLGSIILLMALFGGADDR